MWGFSFFFDCRHLNYVSSNLYANMELLRVESGMLPAAGRHPDAIQAASEGLLNAFETNSERANRFAHWQFRTLVTGAILYVGWHVFEMYLRSPILR